MDDKYSEMLKQITTINKISNMTTYMDDIYNSENTRMNNLKKQSTNNVHKMRSEFMANKYDENYQAYLTNVVLCTFATAAICSIVISLPYYKLFGTPQLISSSISLTITACIIVIYALLLYVYYKSFQQRRNDDWDKFYFAIPSKIPK
jgi:hypothetical protein